MRKAKKGRYWQKTILNGHKGTQIALRTHYISILINQFYPAMLEKGLRMVILIKLLPEVLGVLM